MAKPTDTRSVVEQAIDSILSGKTDAAKVLSTIISESPSKAKEKENKEEKNPKAKELPESITLEEGKDLVCPQCGGEDFEEGFVESEDGQKLAALRCKSCDLGLVEAAEDAEDEGDAEGLVEAEIDENDPKCPSCDSDDLSADMVESDGEQHMVITCNSCKTKMVVAD